MLGQLDSFTGNCGVSLPTLFERIGSMAADGQPPPTRIHAARLHGQRLGSRDTDEGRQGFSGPPPVMEVGVLFAGGPGWTRRFAARAASSGPAQARGLDNRIRMGIAKASRGPIDGPTARRVLPSRRLF